MPALSQVRVDWEDLMATYKMLCKENLSRCWNCLREFAQGEKAAVLVMPDESRRFVHEACSESAIAVASITDWAPAAAHVPSLLQ